MSNTDINLHCIEGMIPFLVWFARPVTACQKYNPSLDRVYYDEEFNELEKIPGFVKTEEYYTQNGSYHRPEEFGPAYLEYYNRAIVTRTYYKYGLLHRNAGPAFMTTKYGFSQEKYYVEGREQKPK